MSIFINTCTHSYSHQQFFLKKKQDTLHYNLSIIMTNDDYKYWNKMAADMNEAFDKSEYDTLKLYLFIKDEIK